MKSIATLIFMFIVILSFGQKVNSSENEINFIESKNSLVELLKQFEDHNVLLEIWSVNCGSCIKQFKFRKELHDFFESKGIITIYLCVGNVMSNLETWKTLIHENHLKGYHAFTSSRFIEDYKIGFRLKEDDLIPLGHNYPYYVLIKKGGTEIRKMKCLPSETDQFMEQISNFIN